MNATRTLGQRFADGHVVMVDGDMGTEIEARGVTMDDVAWCALANLDEPLAVVPRMPMRTTYAPAPR